MTSIYFIAVITLSQVLRPAAGWLWREPYDPPTPAMNFEYDEFLWKDLEFYKSMVECARTVQANIAAHTGIEFSDNHTIPSLDGIILTPDLCELLMGQTSALGKAQERHRLKRAVALDFGKYPARKWPGCFPNDKIYYKIDPCYNASSMKVIRKAIAEYEAKTCIRFEENSEHADIVFVNRQGCFSFIGRVEFMEPQPIYAAEPMCTDGIGTILHLIGHTLGLFDEEQRPDRDEYITIPDGMVDMCFKAANTDLANKWIPYDYDSIMHSLQMPNKKYIATDTTQQNKIGQRVHLSFLDAKTINLLYCDAFCKCHTCDEPIECQNGGYQNSCKCDECICPYGYAPPLCEDVPTENMDICNPVNTSVTASQAEQCVSSPNYPNQFPVFENVCICVWEIERPSEDWPIVLYFKGLFDLCCDECGVCQQWVEIIIPCENRNMRVCCEGNPNITIIADCDVTVVFNPALPVPKIGFELCFFSECPTSTTASTTTEPPTTTTTTTMSTTTTPKDCEQICCDERERRRTERQAELDSFSNPMA